MSETSVTRRRFLGLVALGVGATAIAGCRPPTPSPTPPPTAAPSKPAAQPTPPSTAATPTKQAAQPAKGRPKVTFMVPGSQAEDAAFAPVFEAFAKLYPDIEAVYTPAGTGYVAQYSEKLLTMFAGGVAPDVFKTLAGAFGTWSIKGVYLPLDEYVSANPDITQVDDFFPSHIEGCRVQGKLMALPNDGAPGGMWYNVDLFQQAGFGLPDWDWTWDKLAQATKAITKKEGNITVVHGLGRPAWEQTIWSNGGEVLDPEGRKCLLDRPEAIEALTWMQDLVLKHQAAPTTQSLSEMNDQNRFTSGKLGAFFGVRGGLGQLRTIKGFKFDAAPLVMSNKKKRVTKVVTGLTSIWKSSKSPDAAFKLLAFVCSAEGQRLKISSGFAHPSRKSCIQQDWYKSFACPACNSLNVNSVWPEMLVRGDGRTFPAHPKEAEITQTITTELEYLWDGSKTPAKAAQDMTKAVDKILAS